MTEDKITKILLLILVACLLLVLCLLSKGGDGSTRIYEDRYGSCIVERCLGGHMYYYDRALHKGGLALKVDDNGKPVSCDKGYSSKHLK